MFKASTRIKIAAGIAGVCGAGIVTFWFLCFSPLTKTPTVTVKESCGGFLINDPQIDLLKATNPSEQEKAKLLTKMECYHRQISQNPNYADAYTNLGEASRRLRDLTAARTFQKRAIQLNPHLQEAKLGLALVEQESGNAQAAIQGMREVIAQKQSAIAYFYQGITLAKQNNLQEAEAAFRKAIEFDPKYAEAHVNLGLILNQQGKFDRAVNEIQAAIEINPNLAAAHFNLGVILQAQGELESAIAAYKEAVRLNPDYVEANYNLGLAFKDQGKASEAVAAYQEVIRINPNDTSAYTNLGANLVDQGKSEEAIAQLRTAIRLNPENAEAHNNLGVALFQEKRVAEAISKWNQAIHLNPQYAEAHHNLGVALASQGKLEDAISTLKQARDLYQIQGNTEKADEINQALHQIGVQ